MTKLLVLNGKSYKAAEFDVNFVCDLEEAGISLDDIGKKMLSVIRMYVAVSVGCDRYTAGRLITEHTANGGKIDDIINVFEAMSEESGFFRNEQTDKSTKSPTRAGKKKSENEDVTSEP